MAGNPILFLDSGVGGLPYCHHFRQRNPRQGVVYIADRLRFPYGGRNRDELVAILSDLVEGAVKIFNPKIAVLACNTASISALSELRGRFAALPFVGTVPAVKPATLASKTGKIGVLGTELTVNEPYIRELVAENGGGEIIGIAAPDIVDFIERRFDSASQDEKAAIVRDYVRRFRRAGVDVLVLGCTHFLFLLDEFKQEAAPDITVFDSVRGVTRRVESLLNDIMSSNGRDTPAPNRLVLTGSRPPEPSWLYRAGRLGFSVSLLDEA